VWYFDIEGIDVYVPRWPVLIIMRRKVKTIKLCVNCRHLKVVGEGQEISGLEETRYIETRCDIFNQSSKELYQFPVEEGPLVLDGFGSTDCPFWEAWDLSQKVLEPRKQNNEIKIKDPIDPTNT